MVCVCLYLFVLYMWSHEFVYVGKGRCSWVLLQLCVCVCVCVQLILKAAIHDATMYPATAADNIVARYNFVAGTRPASPNLTFSWSREIGVLSLAQSRYYRQGTLAAMVCTYS